MKKYLVMIFLLGLLNMYFYHCRKQGAVLTAEPQQSSQQPIFKQSRAIASLGEASPSGVQATTSAQPAAVDLANNNGGPRDFYKTYFNEVLLKQNGVARIYQVLKQNLPDTPANDLVAIYIAEGINRNSSPEFGKFMGSLQSALNENSQEVYQALLEDQPILKQGPYSYQMALNLAYNLPLASDQKANLLGQGIAISVDFEQDGNMSAMSANITNALILMKQSGISAQKAAPYIQQGLDMNKESAVALEAFVSRAKSYYPELF